MATLPPTGGTPAGGGATGSFAGSGVGAVPASPTTPALPGGGGAASSASGGSGGSQSTPSAAARAAAVCPECGSADIDYDVTRGDAACVDCGTVVESSSIVSEVGFVEDARGRSSMVGQTVRADGKAAFGALPGFSRQSSEITTANARRRMQYLVAALRLQPRRTESGMRLFQLASEQNFHKGRRLSVVCAAALYVVCRMENSPHMLLDFSDVLETNVYTLGRAVGKFCRLLTLFLPAVDPSMYIHRFAGRLEFGEQTQAVALSALRLVARMRRDWMAEGRRPAGLCGAALLLAARMHNFYRTTTEVVRVVRVGSAVLQHRLREMDATPSAALTAREIDAGGGDEGAVASLLHVTEMEACDPPAWTRGRQLDKAAAAGGKGAAGAAAADTRKGDGGAAAPADAASAKAAASAAAAAAAAIKVYEVDGDDAGRPKTRAAAAAAAAAAATVTTEVGGKGAPNPPAGSDAALLAAASQLTPPVASQEPNRAPPTPDSVEAQLAAAMASPELAALEAEAAADAAAATAATALFHEQGRAADAAAAAADASAAAASAAASAAGPAAAAATAGGTAAGNGTPAAGAAGADDDGSLGELDEEELGGYLNTSAEAAVKTSVWSELNREYLDAQAALERLREEDPEAYAKRKPWKRKRAGGPGGEPGGLPPARTAAEAASRAFARRRSSKKINYAVLKDLFSDGSPAGTPAGGGAGAAASPPGAGTPDAGAGGTPGAGPTSAGLPPLYPLGRGGGALVPPPLPLASPPPAAEPPESAGFFF